MYECERCGKTNSPISNGLNCWSCGATQTDIDTVAQVERAEAEEQQYTLRCGEVADREQARLRSDALSRDITLRMRNGMTQSQAIADLGLSTDEVFEAGS